MSWSFSDLKTRFALIVVWNVTLARSYRQITCFVFLNYGHFILLIFSFTRLMFCNIVRFFFARFIFLRIVWISNCLFQGHSQLVPAGQEAPKAGWWSRRDEWPARTGQYSFDAKRKKYKCLQAYYKYFKENIKYNFASHGSIFLPSITRWL